ncbi:MAG: hypothetical protein NVSMB46_04860 [Candidatus Saccharimonadales bacterium]
MIVIVVFVSWLIFKNSSNNKQVSVNRKSQSSITNAPSSLNDKRELVINNIAAAEKKYQKEHGGQINTDLAKLGVSITDPATGKPYGFSQELVNASGGGSYHTIHFAPGDICNPDMSGYMLNKRDIHKFAFSIERENKSPLCFDFMGKLK